VNSPDLESQPKLDRTDAASRREVEDVLRRERQVLHVMTEHLPVGFYVVDELRDQVLHFNEEFCRLWGFTDLIGAQQQRQLRDTDLVERASLVVEDPATFTSSCGDAQLSTRDVTLDDTIRLRDGRVLRRFSVRLREGDGSYIGRFVLFEDVTARVRAEEARRTFDRRMHEMQKLDSLGVMAGGIAHDFNNLLTSIIGNAELADADVPEDSALHRHLVRILEASTRAADLCHKMLAYTGSGHVHVERVDLSQIMRDTLHLMQPSITTRIRMEEEIAPELPRVLADPLQLAQVVTNIISNACEAYGDNGGRVRIATGSMQAGGAEFAAAVLAPELPAGEYVWLEVEDFGCGMDAATQARIFEPFFSTKFTGRGLGLSAVLGIVRGHRGAIRVESQPARAHACA
jgi:signal transduction histidine kinase